jgi:ATP-binding cassette subfamily F protein 3
MSDLQNKLQVLEKKMADPDLYNAENKAKLKQLLTEQAEYKADLGDTEMSWLETQEQLEEQQAVFEQASSM